ncbi:hypothetical protein JTL72_35200, partial [Pseudomonas aeruginosa]|nr:hypothetical protein [Pseudomonas aeruginosa]
MVASYKKLDSISTRGFLMMASGENLVNEERSMNKEPSSPCACSGGNGQQTACASEQASTETTVF